MTVDRALKIVESFNPGLENIENMEKMWKFYSKAYKD